MAERKAKYWLGTPPERCDLCKQPITSEFYDGATVYGPWANMCPTCHFKLGVGIGVGRGQQYCQSNDKWLKVAG
jgi:hypothetical protein